MCADLNRYFPDGRTKLNCTRGFTKLSVLFKEYLGYMLI